MLALPYQLGRLRYRSLLLKVLMAFAMVGLVGWIGTFVGIVVVVHAIVSWPAPTGLWVIRGADLGRGLWLDAQCVVLGRPYRVIYQDEVAAWQFCRLRRLCLGLPC